MESRKANTAPGQSKLKLDKRTPEGSCVREGLQAPLTFVTLLSEVPILQLLDWTKLTGTISSRKACGGLGEGYSTRGEAWGSSRELGEV